MSPTTQRKKYRPLTVDGVSRIQYALCSNEELDSFIEHRKLALPANQHREWNKDAKKRYLRLADQECHFDFMGLPPELRNMVYAELLHLRPPKFWMDVKCWPQILTVSSRVYSEAKGLMWAVNPISLFVGGVNLSASSFHGNRINLKDFSRVDFALEGVQRSPMLRSLRTGLTQVSRLHLDLSIPGPSNLNPKPAFHMHRLVWSIAMALSENCHLKHASVTALNPHSASLQSALEILYPIRCSQLQKSVKIALLGWSDVPGDVLQANLDLHLEKDRGPSFSDSHKVWKYVLEKAPGCYAKLQTEGSILSKWSRSGGRWIQRPPHRIVKPLRKLEDFLRNPSRTWRGNTLWDKAFEEVVANRMKELSELVDEVMK